jgi:predicted transcriptional regulator
MNKKVMNSKIFIFQYDPNASPKRMFENFKESVETGKKNLQPKNVLVSNSLEAIYRSITPARLEIFTCLIAKKPNNLTELANLLKRDYANV